MNIAEVAQERDTQKGKNLTFIIDNETYGFEIKYVKQIIGVQDITPIPDQPAYIKGVINLRGQIIPIMDIRTKFNKPLVEYDDRTCIIILEVNGMTVGVIVDRVSEVIAIADEDIADTAGITADIQNRFIRGIGKAGTKVIIMLDSRELMKHGQA